MKKIGKTKPEKTPKSNIKSIKKKYLVMIREETNENITDEDEPIKKGS